MKRTASELANIGFYAPFVAAQRMSRMMLPDFLRTPHDRAEDGRMVAEKTRAVADGVIAANLEFSSQIMNAWIGAAFGQMPRPMRAADAIAAAALKPARRRVRENVKRLSKS
jgi:ribulose 1,5-bisphosphate synthetase/thiazole synthase